MLSRVAFRPQALATLLIICSTVLTAAAAWKAVFDWDRYQTDWESGGGLVLGTRLLVLAAGPLLILAGWLRFRRSQASISLGLGSLFPLRAGAYLIVLCLLVTSLGHAAGLLGESRFLVKSFFHSSVLLAFSVWALLLLTRPVRFLQRPPKGRLASADLVVTNLLVIAFLLEVLLNFVAKYSPSPLFWDENSITSTLAALRPQPGHPDFSSRFNSLGYHDQEFFSADSSSLVVGLLADSFGVGIVPHSFNFATIAERILQEERQDSLPRVVIHNFGVVGIGMPEIRIPAEKRSALLPSFTGAAHGFCGQRHHEGPIAASGAFMSYRTGGAYGFPTGFCWPVITGTSLRICRKLENADSFLLSE